MPASDLRAWPAAARRHRRNRGVDRAATHVPGGRPRTVWLPCRSARRSPCSRRASPGRTTPWLARGPICVLGLMARRGGRACVKLGMQRFLESLNELSAAPSRCRRSTRDPRRRRQRQDPRADHPHRLAPCHWPGQPAGRARGHVHEQGRREMATRLNAMLPINTRGMIGTFRRPSNRMLRAHARRGAAADLPDPRSADQLGAIKRMCKRLGVYDERIRRANPVLRQYAKGRACARRTSDRRRLQPALRRAYAEYDAQCQREGVIDAELLLRS